MGYKLLLRRGRFAHGDVGDPDDVLGVDEVREAAAGLDHEHAAGGFQTLHVGQRVGLALLLEDEVNGDTLDLGKRRGVAEGELSGLGGDDHIHGRLSRIGGRLCRDKRGHAGETNKTGEE